ncbi:hypothetical protein V4S79_19845, partial [Citrobacter freundii]|uniref:hypothetical protein n=1 Tax=Citrobacter freundii TaxID=546 RepID=UPI002F960A0E
LPFNYLAINIAKSLTWGGRYLITGIQLPDFISACTTYNSTATVMVKKNCSVSAPHCFSGLELRQINFACGVKHVRS